METGMVVTQGRGNPPSSGEVGPGKQEIPPLPLLAAVGVVGIAIGWLVSQASPGNDPRLARFQHHPWYIVWSSMGALFVALWLILGCVALWQICSLSLDGEGSRWSRA